MYLGGFIVCAGIFSPVEVFDNRSVVLLGFGLFLFALGVWVQPPGGCFLVDDYSHASQNLIEIIKRIGSRLPGIILLISGIILTVYGVWEIVKHYII